jgi:hypothetical protein
MTGQKQMYSTYAGARHRLAFKPRIQAELTFPTTRDCRLVQVEEKHAARASGDLSDERFGLISLCVVRTLRTGRSWDQNCSVGLRPGSYTKADGAEYRRSRYVCFRLT